MAVSLKHQFTSAKSDGGDSTLVQPSNWNAEHTLTLANNRVLGRNAGTDGAAQELTGDDLRTLTGLATGDSPQFTAINLGHASDTTIARTGAGDIAIEGNAVYRAGGTDVAIADGGTGASDAATAFANLKQAATDSATGVVELATDAETQAGTDTARAVTPAGLRSATREKLTADRTYYVRTDGSDSNTGLADTAGGAFLTVAKAIAACLSIDCAGYELTIQFGAGSWGAITVVAGPVGVKTWKFLGDTATPANVKMELTVYNTKVTVSGIQFESVTSGWAGLAAWNGAAITVSTGCAFGVSARAHMWAVNNAIINPTASYSIAGECAKHIEAITNSVIIMSGITVTLNATYNFATAFVECLRGGVVSTPGITWSGSATGVRYSVTANGVAFTSGGGASYFPGNAAGSTATGGQYL